MPEGANGTPDNSKGFAERVLGGMVRERLAVLRRERPTIRVLMYPAAEQNPYLVVTRQLIERLGGRVTMLHELESKEVLTQALSHDILHVFNIREYQSPFNSPQLLRQLQHFSRRMSKLWLAKRLRMRIFWTLYNEPKGAYTSEWLERVGRRWMFHQADRIICPSMATRELLKKRYPEMPDRKVLHIPHHDFGDYYPKQVSRRQALDYLGIKPKGRVFICFGGIHPYKGLTDLIPLFGKHPLREHTLIVAGSPSNKHYAATIEGLCQRYDNVHAYLRYVPSDDVQYYMQAADIAVMPYKDVLNSGSLMLALSFGKPIVAPAVGSIPEVVNSACAVLFNQSGSAELKAALTQSLSMNVEHASSEARRLRQQYDAEKLSRRLVNSYLEFFPKRAKLPEEAEEL